MEEVDYVLLTYIKQGLSNGNHPNDLKINALSRGYSPKAFDLALAKAHEAQEDTNQIMEQQKEKKSLSKHIFGLQSSFIFPLTWTIFFLILGIIVQSFVSGSFVFFEFFSSNLLGWVAKFNFFSSTTQYNSIWYLLQALVGEWYYFGFVGGLISLIWVTIVWFLNVFRNK